MKSPKKEFNEEQGRILLKLARQTICRKLGLPTDKDEDRALTRSFTCSYTYPLIRIFVPNSLFAFSIRLAKFTASPIAEILFIMPVSKLPIITFPK